MKAYLTLDVGGTQIKSALLSDTYEPLEAAVRYPARSAEGRACILQNLTGIVEAGLGRAAAKGYTTAGVGIAFPGPFDYARGVSLIQGIGKYDALYGFSLGDFLRSLPCMAGLPLLFANDADLYCLGECLLGEGRNYERVMLCCIGTGLGSGFVEKGRLIKSGARVPPDGWLFRQPFRDGVLDGWLSATGLRRLIGEAAVFPAGTDAKELAEAACKGDSASLDIWNTFGDMLAEALPPYARRFGAQAVFLGGQVTRSAGLFTDSLSAALKEEGIRLHISADSSLSAMQALPLLLEGKAVNPYTSNREGA